MKRSLGRFLSIATSCLVSRVMILSIWLLGCHPLASHAQDTKHPNIVFILADDLGYGDVKCFNPEGRIPTPHIDKLAQQGMRFTDAHAASSVCTPSRYAILTGRYPWRSEEQQGVLSGYDKPLIDSDRLTVAGLLKNEGYYTACIGKWHLGMNWPLKPGYDTIKTGWEIDYSRPVQQGPDTRGFHYFYGISASLDMPPYLFIENDRAVSIPSVTKQFPWRKGPAASGFEAVNVLPSITRKAQKTIATQAKKKRPFFLYLALPSPHTPIVPDQSFLGKSGMTAYGDYVMETDWAVGQVMKTLDSMKISDNTIVFFASDNGCTPSVLGKYRLEKSGHYPSYIFRGYKSDIWDGGHRIPLVVRWPGTVPAGAVSNDLVSLTDFMATCADILKITLPGDAAVDSYTILPALRNEAHEQVRPTIVYASIGGYFSIQQGKWKLAFCPGSGGWESPNNKQAFLKGWPLVQLYDMDTDITERMNVEAQHPEVVERLTRLMEQYISNGRSTPGKFERNNVKVDLWKKEYTKNATK